MSTTIGDLVDRVFREYLEPADDLNSYTTVEDNDSITGGNGISSSDTTLSFNPDLLTQEEEDVMDAGTILECEHELMYCTDIDTVNNTITVVRGTRGTTAAQHLKGSLVKIAPAFTRKAVFDAVVDQINNLFPSVFAVDTQSITTGTGYTLIGSYDSVGTHNYLVSVLGAVSQYTDFSAGSDTTGVNFLPVACSLIELPNPFTYTDSDGTERTMTYSTGPSVVHALQFSGIASGHTAYVTFKKKFIEPTAEADTLSTIGLENEYEPIIMAGVAAQLMSGRDIPSATSSYITEQMSVQGYPVGASNNIRNSLLQYQERLLQQARKYLRSKYPEAVAVDGLVYGIQS
tara:strand:- start:2296 stop:3330 length:1035 start_codon:yes stop_codon:yes gene_type:complete